MKNLIIIFLGKNFFTKPLELIISFLLQEYNFIPVDWVEMIQYRIENIDFMVWE